jgi:hypothetical protein
MRQSAASLLANYQRFIPLLATALLALVAYGSGAILYRRATHQVFFNMTGNSYLLISAVGMTLVIHSGGLTYRSVGDCADHGRDGRHAAAASTPGSSF